MIVTIIGRGHSGTRAISHTLSESGVYMGAELNGSGDLIPAEDLYEACRVFGRHVGHHGGLNWDFSETHTMPIDPAFTRLVESYLGSVLGSDEPVRGWKLPETTLVLPWIVRLFPEARYIYWMRDPRDCVLGEHLTDDLARFGVPCDPIDDVTSRRVVSWMYQYKIMKETPPPVNKLDLRFEEFVLNQGSALRNLEEFLGIPLAAIAVRPEAIGRWRSHDGNAFFDLFPDEALFHGEHTAVPG